MRADVMNQTFKESSPGSLAFLTRLKAEMLDLKTNKQTNKEKVFFSKITC